MLKKKNNDQLIAVYTYVEVFGICELWIVKMEMNYIQAGRLSLVICKPLQMHPKFNSLAISLKSDLI